MGVRQALRSSGGQADLGLPVVSGLTGLPPGSPREDRTREVAKNHPRGTPGTHRNSRGTRDWWDCRGLWVWVLGLTGLRGGRQEPGPHVVRLRMIRVELEDLAVRLVRLARPTESHAGDHLA